METGMGSISGRLGEHAVARLPDARKRSSCVVQRGGDGREHGHALPPSLGCTALPAEPPARADSGTTHGETAGVALHGHVGERSNVINGRGDQAPAADVERAHRTSVERAAESSDTA